MLLGIRVGRATQLAAAVSKRSRAGVRVCARESPVKRVCVYTSVSVQKSRDLPCPLLEFYTVAYDHIFRGMVETATKNRAERFSP